MHGMNEFENESRDAVGGDNRLQITDYKSEEDVRGATGHRRNGKIARLPRDVREQINELLDDGVDYDTIIEKLGDAGKELNKQNLCNWVQGGYRDWVKERERKALLEGNFSRVVDLLAKAEPDEVPDLIVKLMAARVGGVLSGITPQDLHENSEKDPRNLVRLLSLVPKLSREALRTRKYRRAVQREEAAELKERDPNRPFGDESDHRAVVDIVDRVLGLGRYTKPRKDERTSNIQLPSVSTRPPNVERAEEDNRKSKIEDRKNSEDGAVVTSPHAEVSGAESLSLTPGFNRGTSEGGEENKTV
jgi:hypothetical protein